jgi:hypothetical protein
MLCCRESYSLEIVAEIEPWKTIGARLQVSPVRKSNLTAAAQCRMLGQSLHTGETP